MILSTPELNTLNFDGQIRYVRANVVDLDNMLLRYRSKNYFAKFLRGNKMKNWGTLFDEFSAALQFGSYFGENLPAFNECLSEMDNDDIHDIQNCAGITIGISNSRLLFADSSVNYDNDIQLSKFIQTLKNASTEYSQPVAKGYCWDRPALPFHVVLQETPENIPELVDTWTKAGAMLQEIVLPVIDDH